MGLVLCIQGILLQSKSKWYSSNYDYVIDLTGYNKPIGYLFIILGTYALYKTLLCKRYAGNDLLICIECQQPIKRKYTKDNQCPTCDVELEPLDGFYDRHPELKGK